jgi:hypothetical protein
MREGRAGRRRADARNKGAFMKLGDVLKTERERAGLQLEEVAARPVFNLFYPGGLPLDKLADCH